MRIPLAHLHERAPQRPAGYVEEVLSRGRVIGDELELTDETWRDLVEKFRPREPTLMEMAGNFAKATAQFVMAGMPVCSQEQFKARRAVCDACPEWMKDAAIPHCRRCGCAGLKLWLVTERCPLDKWPA